MISIITSLYKSDRYLPEYKKNLEYFSDHLLKRNFDFEVIVIANEASDDEKKLADFFKNQSWFKFISVPRESLYASWNRGVKMAQGEILEFWNVDDVRYPGAVIEAQELFKGGAELVHFPFYIKRYLKFGSWYLPLPSQKIDKQVPQYGPTTKKLFLEGMVCGPFFMFTKGLYEKVGPFDEQFKIAGDFDWCIRAAKATDKIVKAKTIGGVFRVDGGGLSAGANERLVAENNTVFTRHGVLHKVSSVSGSEKFKYNPNIIKAWGKEIEFK